MVSIANLVLPVNPEYRVLQKFEEMRSYAHEISQIGDANSTELGFLPYSAYAELALKNQIWVVPDESTPNRVRAYIAFGGNRSTLKVIQLYVSPSSRGSGLGTKLVELLKTHAIATSRQVIAARVANDLSANYFWEQQGFYVVRQIAGGRTSQRKLNVRIYDVPSSSLFSDPHAGSASDWLCDTADKTTAQVPIYALDLNVFFDVLHARPRQEFVSAIFSSAFGGEIRLCVSPELAREIARASKEAASDPLLRIASSLPVLEAASREVSESLLDSLREIVFPDRSSNRRGAANDVSDLRHLANCISAGVSAFVTSEHAIIRAAERLHSRFGLEVLSPQDVVSLAALTRDWDFQPAKVSVGVAISSRQYRDVDYEAITSLCQELNLDTSGISEFFGTSTSALRKIRIVVLLGTKIVGFAAHCISANVQAVARSLVLVQEGVSRAQLVVDHLLGGALSEIPKQRLLVCELVTAETQLLTRATAQRLGFRKNSIVVRGFSNQRKLAFSGAITPNTWQTVAQSIATRTGTELPLVCPGYFDAMSSGLVLRRKRSSTNRTISLMAMEAALSPMLLLAPGRPALIVPIREKQANELLPEIRQQSPLFEKEAGILIERAYFSKSPAARKIVRGSLIAFYVSGAEGGRGEAVGIARVTSAGDGKLRSMNSGLFTQGVLDARDLTDGNLIDTKIVFFTFESFLKFSRPVPFRSLMDAKLVGKANLVTAQPLEFDQLITLVEMSGMSELKK